MTRMEKPSIMVVDDQPVNLKLLEEMLKELGYGVRSFPRGRLALAAAVQHPPDLILLDINMPEMDGFEVCRQLKANVKLSRIPVIFLSALNETEDKVRAFQAGGVDYITKPFQCDEMRSRMETHLQLHQLQKALQEQNDQLEEIVRSRTRELAEALARVEILDQSKGDFLNLISHEFRTPLNGLLGIAEILLDASGSESKEFREMFDESRRRIMTILDHALLLTQIDIEGDKFAMERVSLPSLLSAALEAATEFARSRNVTLVLEPTDSAVVLGTMDLLVKAFQALLETAVKFSDPGGTVRIVCSYPPKAAHVAIESQGRSLPASAIPKFFDIFSIGETITQGGDLGLGTSLAHRILSLCGGSAAIKNRLPSGIEMTVALRSA